MDNNGFAGDSKESGLENGYATRRRAVPASSVKSLGVILDPTKLGPLNNSADSQSLIDADYSTRSELLTEQTVVTQKTFDETYKSVKRPTPTLKGTVSKKITKACRCSPRCLKDFVFGLLPCINIMRNYKIRSDLPGDLVSGLTVGIMHIPQGMAYGMLTSLPPIFGLYTSFFPVFVYFLFGSSKHISMGTFAVASLMIGSSVSNAYDSYSATHMVGNSTAAAEDGVMSDHELSIRLKYAMALTFMVGVMQIGMSFLRLGFVTVYLSDPLISGFTTGAACHVFTSQIKHVFGITTDRFSGPLKLVYTYRDFFQNIPQTNSITLVASILFMALLYSVTRFINQNPKLKPKMFMPVPIELIVWNSDWRPGLALTYVFGILYVTVESGYTPYVVLGTLISYYAKLSSKYNVKIVGTIPVGLPAPSSPFMYIQDMFGDAIALSIVLFAISISMAKILAKKHDYEVDPNQPTFTYLFQELLAYGACNIFCSFFSAFSPSASLSRSLVQERVGGRTQVAGLVSCVLLLIVLLAIGPLFQTLPNCVLASIIICALKGMFLQVLDLKRLWKVSIIDFFVWVVSFSATVLLDVDLGLGASVIFGILTVVMRSQKPYACMLGRISGTKNIYRDVNVYTEAIQVEGVKIFRFEQSLFFVNTETFRTLLYKNTMNPRHLKIVQKKRASKKAKLEKKKKSKAEDILTIELDVNINDSTKNGSAVQTHQCPSDVDFHTIILECSSWNFVDSMGVKVLSSIIAEYNLVGVKMYMANCKAALREMFDKTEFYSSVDRHHVFVTVHDAVLYCTQQSPEHRESVSLQVSAKMLPLDDVQYIDDRNDQSDQNDQNDNKQLRNRIILADNCTEETQDV